jgi:hypothetical protein
MTSIKNLHIKYIAVIIVLVAIAVLSLTAMFDRTDRMFAAEDALSSAQSQLTGTLGELSLKTTALSAAEFEVTITKTNIAVAQNQLTQTQGTLAKTAAELTATTGRLTTAEAGLAASSAALTVQSELISTLQDSFDRIKVNLDRMTAGYGYVQQDPSFKEMMSFLQADRTDSKTYNRDNYNCVDFSAEVIANAARQKIRCGFINISFPDSGHAIIVFNTTDRGVIYIEPQSDEEVKLQMGKQFWQCVVLKAGYYYTKPSYNDTIVKINVIW